MRCCICGCNITGYGNNPFPICAKDDARSRCCDKCNSLVINARLISMRFNTHRSPEVGDTLIIYYSESTDTPVKTILFENRFISGKITEIKNEDGKTCYYGDWGNFSVTDNDSFVVSDS